MVMTENKKEFTILITDDEKSNLDILSGILSPRYNLLIAREGPRALELANEHKPDLILLDVLMPGMSGFEVLTKLKESEETDKIPVIIITGLTNVEDEEKGLFLGAVDYITKPFSSVIIKMRVLNQIKLLIQTRTIIAKEIEEKHSRAKREFLSRMSHEMRTPMNVIIGMTEVAKDIDETEERNDCLDKVSAASRYLLQLIDNLLDMHAIESNKLLFVDSEFSFAELIREILTAANPGIKEKQQNLIADIDPSIPDMLVGDKSRVAQIILNLLSNAEKFTSERGTIQIRAFVREIERETLTIQIEVVDNGIGISEEQQEALFAPFEQVDGGVDREFEGAGLGLAISKYIIETMGGKIWVESQQGKGAKFAFTIKEHTQSPDPAEAAKPVSYPGKAVLLAEDIGVNRESCLTMLKDTGMRILCARDGREALELFTAQPEKVDMIIMDANMPEMGGVETARRIRALGTPEGARAPIVALTANALDDKDVEDYIAAGINEYIRKPVDSQKLKSILDKYFEGLI